MIQKIAKYKDSKTFETDEINLVAIIRTFWRGKWIILLTMFLSCVAAFLFYQSKPKQVRFSIAIKKIHIDYFDYQYLYLNFLSSKTSQQTKGLNFTPVTQNSLLNLYLDNIVSSEVVTQAVTASKLFTDNNNSDEAFQNKIQSIIRAIKIFQVASVDPKQQTFKTFEKLSYQHRLDFTFNDLEKGKLFLANLHQFTNKKVRSIIVENYNQNINSFEYLRSLKLDEINDAIQLALFAHEETTKKRIEYLKEQSQIARTLGIAKNTLGTENFSVGNGSITNVKSDTPFYFRGYEAIEKEIQLMEARKDPRLYANGIIELEKQKKSLEDNKNITNLKFVLSNSDLSKEDRFKAADYFIVLGETANERLIQMLLIAIALGFVLSCLFVLVRNSLRT